MELSLFTVGGISAFVYAGVTLFLYVYLWTRWSIVNGGEASQILTMIHQKHNEWSVLWWSIAIIPYAMIPVFLAVLMSLWKDEPALASMAFIACFRSSMMRMGFPVRTNGAYSSVIAATARLLFVPITIRSGFIES